MKLVQCDVCKKTFKEGGTGKVYFKEGTHSSVLVDDGKDGYWNIDEVNVDVCRKCSIEFLKILLPDIKFLPLEKYK